MSLTTIIIIIISIITVIDTENFPLVADDVPYQNVPLACPFAVIYLQFPLLGLA